MTLTYNGFGTTYARAEQRLAAPGRCGSCGRFGRLESYNTHLAVAVLYIPTVRLKPLRVIHECKACGNHIRMDRAAWTAATAAAAADIARARTSGTPADVGAAFAAFAAIASVDEAATVIGDVRVAVGDDAVGLAHVGAGLLALNDLDGAKAAFERSLAVAHTIDVELQLGLVELCRDAPVAAHAHLEGIWRHRQREAVDLALLLVDCLLAHGESVLAARVTERLVSDFPDLAKDQELQALRRSVQAQHAGRRVFSPRHGAIVQRSRAAVQRATPPVNRSQDRLVFGVLGAAAVALYVLVGVGAMRAGPVHVVSGAVVAYDVEIDGETLHLAPGAALKRNLGFGAHHLVVHAPTGDRSFDVDFGASLLTAPFHLIGVKVLNPDRLAVVVREETEYARRFLGKNDTEQGRYSYDVLTGPVIVTQARFAFEPYPESIEMRTSSEMISRVATDQSGPLDSTEVLRGKRGDDEARAHLLARLAFFPGDVAALDTLLDDEARKARAKKDAEKQDDTDSEDDDDEDAVVYAADVIAAVDAVLAARPVDVEGWLRADEADLVEKDDIDALIAAADDSGDPCMVYLAKVFGAEGTPERRVLIAGCANEQIEAGIRAAILGDVDEARDVLSAVSTSALTPYRLQRWSLLAQLLHELPQLEARIRSSSAPLSFEHFALRLGMLAQQGALTKAQLLLPEALKNVDDDGATAAHHDLILAYNAGDVDAFVASLPKVTDVDFDFERILVTGSFDEEYEHIKSHDVEDRLLFWASVLSRHPQHPSARRELTKLFTELEQPTWMTAAPSVSALSALGADWAMRRASAIALAVLHDDGAMLDEAWRLCRPTSTPTLLVQRLRAARAPTTPEPRLPLGPGTANTEAE